MSLAILFHFLCAQHVSDINIAIIRSLRLCSWNTTFVDLFLVRCVLEIWCGWFEQYPYWRLQPAIRIHETCWAHKKWNKIRVTSDIELVFYSSAINSHLSRNPQIGCCVHNDQPLVTFPSQINQIHTHSSCILWIHFNIVLSHELFICHPFQQNNLHFRLSQE